MYQQDAQFNFQGTTPAGELTSLMRMFFVSARRKPLDRRQK
jgi:hypothetical protein